MPSRGDHPGPDTSSHPCRLHRVDGHHVVGTWARTEVWDLELLTGTTRSDAGDCEARARSSELECAVVSSVILSGLPVGLTALFLACVAGFTKWAIVCRALRKTSPGDRPAILQALAGIFPGGGMGTFGPFGRRAAAQAMDMDESSLPVKDRSEAD